MGLVTAGVFAADDDSSYVAKLSRTRTKIIAPRPSWQFFSRRSIHNKYQIGEASWPLSYLIICPIKIPARNVASRLPRLSGSRTDRAGRRISGSAPTAATGSKRSHSSARRTSTLTRSRPDDNRPALRTIVVRVFAHLRRNGGGTEALISPDDFFIFIGTCARRAWVNPDVARVACRYLKSLRRFVAAGNPNNRRFFGNDCRIRVFSPLIF